jgi:hypothetical protein
MFSSNTSQIVSGPTGDPQFNYVTMLLHGDGTNGGQNNTFLDASTNNFTITRNGGTTQGSFSPYGTNWSNYFDGTGDYLTVPSNAAFAFGTGDFTIEGWVFVISAPADLGIFQQGTSYFPQTTTNSLALGIESSGVWQAYAKNTNANSTISYTRNAWAHFAFVRSGTTTTLYINGASAITFTSDSTNYTGQFFGIGSIYGDFRNINAYISNLRVVKGTAVYTSAFTPSTTPLTAVSGTSLLTCADNRFIDDSTNNFTITRNGDVSVQRFNPFGTATAYSTSVFGSSGFFPFGSVQGSSSARPLAVPNNSAFNLTGDFTVELWHYGAYPVGTSSNNMVFLGSDFDAGRNQQIGLNADCTRMGIYHPSTLFQTSSIVSGIVGSWNYYAYVRSGSTVTFYFNGVNVGSVTNTQTFTMQNGAFGALGGYGGAPAGYLSDFRVNNSTALYSSNFTPPTAPISAISGTTCLLSFTNGAIFDNAMMNDLETVGNAQISTSVVKFGTGSIYNPATVSGSGLKCYLGVNGTINGNYTLEWWAYHSNLNSGINHVMLGPWGSQLLVRVDNGTAYQIYIASASRLDISVASAGIVATTWQHYAITRSGSTNYAFVNGIQVGTWTQTGVINLSTLSVASENAGVSNVGDQLVGYMDDVRLTNGVARYTANFTPPTAAFPNF